LTYLSTFEASGDSEKQRISRIAVKETVAMKDNAVAMDCYRRPIRKRGTVALWTTNIGEVHAASRHAPAVPQERWGPSEKVAWPNSVALLTKICSVSLDDDVEIPTLFWIGPDWSLRSVEYHAPVMEGGERVLTS
jgi:hypothetical protein